MPHNWLRSSTAYLDLGLAVPQAAQSHRTSSQAHLHPAQPPLAQLTEAPAAALQSEREGDRHDASAHGSDAAQISAPTLAQLLQDVLKLCPAGKEQVGL